MDQKKYQEADQQQDGYRTCKPLNQITGHLRFLVDTECVDPEFAARWQVYLHRPRIMTDYRWTFISMPNIRASGKGL